MLKGIDISSWQGQPDFSKVKEAVDFVIVKATEGVGFRDPQLTRNQKECRKLGITLGYYAFVRPDLGNFHESEAQYFLNQIGPLQEGELLFLDFEVSYSKRVDWCKGWLDYIHAKSGVKAPIYLNKSLVAGSDWSKVIGADYGLWLADYTYKSDSPVPDTQWPLMAFRQYSNADKIPGISGNVDANVFYGDTEALKAYGFKGTSIAPPDDCENQLELLGKKVADLHHLSGERKLKITDLEYKLETCSNGLKVVSIDYQIALGVINSNKTKMDQRNLEIVRLQNQKFYLNEIINFFIVWLKTGGDSTNA